MTEEQFEHVIIGQMEACDVLYSVPQDDRRMKCIN